MSGDECIHIERPPCTHPKPKASCGWCLLAKAEQRIAEFEQRTGHPVCPDCHLSEVNHYDWCPRKQRTTKAVRREIGPLPPTLLWVDHAQQCGAVDPDDKHGCTIAAGHVGAHVAIDPVFGNPMAAWPGNPRTDYPRPGLEPWPYCAGCHGKLDYSCDGILQPICYACAKVCRQQRSETARCEGCNGILVQATRCSDCATLTGSVDPKEEG